MCTIQNSMQAPEMWLCCILAGLGFLFVLLIARFMCGILFTYIAHTCRDCMASSFTASRDAVGLCASCTKHRVLCTIFLQASQSGCDPHALYTVLWFASCVIGILHSLAGVERSCCVIGCSTRHGVVCTPATPGPPPGVPAAPPRPAWQGCLQPLSWRQAVPGITAPKKQ